MTKIKECHIERSRKAQTDILIYLDFCQVLKNGRNKKSTSSIKKGGADTQILGVYEVNFSFILPLICFFLVDG